MNYDNNIEINAPQRRVLRQSTLPSTLQNPDAVNYYQNNKNLTAPTSPKLGQLSPQYSAYSTEDVPKCDIQPQPPPQQTQPTPSQRFTVRRQSTLPCRPTDQQHSQIYMSTSPNRPYSRSPERSDIEQRYPPFVRQSTFPSNSSETYSHRPKILPTSPSRYNQFSDETGEYMNKPRVVRQATLPNPDQHMKLLPTSPPKRQTSPQYLKRSPEFIRQNTMPNPESLNSLTVHQQSNKFLPISPRQKQNFLFPTPQNPRQFLSQQNVPTVADADQYSSSQSVNIHGRDHTKMIKVRSHSNEEYTVTRTYPPEGRRLLPEIPLNRSPR